MYQKHLSEPWFTLLFLRYKLVEGRPVRGDWAAMAVGDRIEFYSNEFGYKRTFTFEISNITEYDSWEEMLETEGLEQCLPGIKTMHEGVIEYEKFYGDYNGRVRAFRFVT